MSFGSGADWIPKTSSKLWNVRVSACRPESSSHFALKQAARRMEEEPLTHQLTQIRGKTEELGGELGVPALALSLVFRSLKAAICRLMLTSVMGEGQWGHVSLLRSVLILPEMSLIMEDLGILALLYFVAPTLVLHSDWTSRNTCWEFLSHHWISGPLVC